jgi:UPF0148 protein
MVWLFYLNVCGILVMNMDEDEVLKKITRLLEEGCTMLATHHDCGAPLFRCKGEVVCPVCSFETNETPSGAATQQLASVAPKEAISKHETSSVQHKSPIERISNKDIPEDDELIRIKTRLFESMLRKLELFTDGLEGEQDLDQLIKQLDCIEGLLRNLRSIQR